MTVVTAAIIWNGEKVLISRRMPGQRMAGYWEFPGGKIEAGESPQACLERELMEEFGITAKAGDQIAESVYRYDHGTIRLVALSTEILAGEPELTVHDRIAWVLPEDLLDYKLAPADVPIAEKINS
ncbi:MAG: (deoxy)nucleoside triphosphate pyrophosphohydrolase [Desulfobacterales bacterium]|nr:(deoxy)nucleoside triphosphate pyrophosphohydrolase [Desulfobacterales bacterium]